MLFYWEGILKYSTIQPILGPQSVNLTDDFIQGTIFLFDQKSTFPSQLGFGSVVVTAATGQPYPEVPFDRARMGLRIIKADVAPNQNNRNHNMPPLKIMDSKVRKKDMLVPRKIRCELAFPPCESLGLWKLW